MISRRPTRPAQWHGVVMSLGRTREVSLRLVSRVRRRRASRLILGRKSLGVHVASWLGLVLVVAPPRCRQDARHAVIST